MNKIISSGLHKLSGIERVHTQTQWGDDVEGIRFVLDDKTYECYEDPEDGYRSSGGLVECNKKCAYRFQPQAVMAEWFDGCDSEYSTYKTWHLTLKDQYTGLDVLKIGTVDYNDYYPMAIFHYNPENMKINQNR